MKCSVQVFFFFSSRGRHTICYRDWSSDVCSADLQPPDERRTDLKRLNFSRPILLRRVMEKYNDTHKPIWISEYAWISLPPDFKGDPSKNIWGKSVDEQTQARYLVEGYERAMSEWPWMGVMAVW